MLAVRLGDGYITEQEYLEGEKVAEERHEYLDGKVYAMAGASKRHNEIALNIAFALRPSTKNDLCRVFSSDVKVRAGKRKAFYYPDVVAGCVPDDADDYYLENPCLIVEVTSKSTEWKDRHEKAIVYQTLSSLQSYLVVSQDKPHVTVYCREDDGSWWVSAYEGLDQAIPLPCPPMMLALVDIYDGISFTRADVDHC